MDKMTFASYKFKPSDVIEGLNRYFAETKVFLCKVPLEIKNGEVKPGNYYVIRNIVFNAYIPKIKEYGYYYIICDPEEVVGVAINWLREKHGIFYTPGMEVPFEDFDVDEAAKEYEKETRTSDIFCEEKLKETTKDFDVDEAFKKYPKRTLRDRIEELQESRRDYIADLQKSLYEAKRRTVALENGHAEKSKIIDRQAARIKDLEKRIAEKDSHIEGLEADIDITNRLVKEQQEFITKVAALLETKDPYIEREYAHVIDVLSNIVKHPNLHRWRYNDLKGEILKVYREIFDCSNGDPEGSDAETLQDILTEYQRVLELKNVAEEKTIKYKELARENEEQAAKYKVRLDNAERQLRWTEEVSSERLKKCVDLVKEREKVKRMEQKLIDIQDICER